MIRCFLTVLMLTLFFGTVSHAGQFRAVTDMSGRTVKIPVEIHRVYAIGHCLPMVSAVAPEKVLNSFRLTGDAKRFLPKSYYEGKVVPKAGIRFSDEEIVTMRPEIVILEDIPGNPDKAERLQRKLNIPVLLLSQDMRRYKEAFSFLGNVLDARKQAALLSDFVTTYLDPIRRRAAAIPQKDRVRVYYAENPDGLSTNPSGSIHSQVLDFVGAVNVADVANIPGEGMSQVSLEQLMIWQPRIILVWTPGADRLTTYNAIVNNPLWKGIDAVVGKRVYQVPWRPLSWFDRPPGTNRIIGVVWLANLLYPDIFPYDMVKVTQDYFKRFYRYDLTAGDAELLLSPVPKPVAASRNSSP